VFRRPRNFGVLTGPDGEGCDQERRGDGCRPDAKTLTHHRRLCKSAAAIGWALASATLVRRGQILAVAVVALAIGARATRTVDRSSYFRRAQVWQRMETSSADVMRGPSDVHGFEPNAVVPCEYEPLTLGGNSPKFACQIDPSDTVKVKYGTSNGEVFAEVAATRLAWALGFGADRVYPVQISCKKCPSSVAGGEGSAGRVLVEFAAIERKLPARSPLGIDDGWSWHDLESVSEADGGAPRSHRDALKLFAVFLQHTDTKMPQQRLVCLDATDAVTCARPLMMLNDLGLTFGRASRLNTNATSSANLELWSQTPVWRDRTRCVGNLPRSFSGTLENPAVSEAGRAFLAERLNQLSDKQIEQLFTVARFDRRARDPRDPGSAPATVREWVDAFKARRAEITATHCPA
jgi:hypothetical protein